MSTANTSVLPVIKTEWQGRLNALRAANDVAKAKVSVLVKDAAKTPGGLKSELQHLATPVRCEDDEKIPTDAGRRARDAGCVDAAGQDAARDCARGGPQRTAQAQARP